MTKNRNKFSKMKGVKVINFAKVNAYIDIVYLSNRDIRLGLVDKYEEMGYVFTML